MQRGQTDRHIDVRDHYTFRLGYMVCLMRNATIEYNGHLVYAGYKLLSAGILHSLKYVSFKT